MKKLLACLVFTTVLLSGCNSAKPLPRELVIVPDISASIEPDAEKQMFAAIEEVAQNLRRGDTLTIIPITGDAEAELQGRMLHYSVPTVEDRQAYDADLRTLHAQIKGDLARLQAEAFTHPGKHTDILGTLRISMREFSGRATDKRLIVLSDFIQDDEQFNFRKDPRLANEAAAAALGGSVTRPDKARSAVQVVLGRLRSRDFSALPRARQRSIDVFWEQLLAPAQIEPDGSAQCKRQ